MARMVDILRVFDPEKGPSNADHCVEVAILSRPADSCRAFYVPLVSELDQRLSERQRSLST